jgi:hypothetical protein
MHNNMKAHVSLHFTAAWSVLNCNILYGCPVRSSGWACASAAVINGFLTREAAAVVRQQIDVHHPWECNQ